jgi:hypothetical protein
MNRRRSATVKTISLPLIVGSMTEQLVPTSFGNALGTKTRRSLLQARNGSPADSISVRAHKEPHPRVLANTKEHANLEKSIVLCIRSRMTVLAQQLDDKLATGAPKLPLRFREWYLSSSSGQIPMLSTSFLLGESNKRFSTYSMRTKPGEVWLADLGIAEKTRPILVVSREDTDQLPTSRVWLPFQSLAFSVVSAKSPAKCWLRSKRRFDLLSISRRDERPGRRV